MADPRTGQAAQEENVSPDFRLLSRHTERIVEEVLDRRGFRGGGDGPTDGGMERRLAAVEASHTEIKGTLTKLLERTSTIDAKLDATASAVDLAKVAGRVEALPTTWQMITLVIGIVGTILGGAFLILKFGLPHSP